ncbi:MAG: hypothetical protein ABSE72_11675 [Bacteroidales bacterium]
MFHKTPAEDRLKIHSASRLKRSRRRRRKFRHMFFYFRSGTLKRYNRKLNAEIRKVKESPTRYQRLSGKAIVHEAIPAISSPKPSFRERLHRSIRMVRYVIRKARQRKPNPDVSPGKKRSKIYRKLRYLYRRGNLFNINLRAILEFMDRNYSFLGKGKYLIILLNSTFIFLLAYLFVFLLKEMAAVIAASTFDIKSVMMYYDVEYLIRSRDWTVDAIKLVFSVGPFFAIMLTLIAVIIFAISSHENWTVRLFIMWVVLHAFTQSFGEMIFGALLNQGFGWVLAYLYVDETAKMLLVVGILLGMLSGGLFLSRFILLTGNIYFNTIGKVNRIPFLMSQIFLPFLIGTGIIILVKQPLINSFELVVEGSMFFIILPAMLRARFSNDLFFDEEPRKIRIKWVWVLITLASFILFRIYFWKGVRI